MPPSQETIRVQLNYPPNRVKEPVVYRLVVDFGLVPNIRRANIDLREGGFIFMELTGSNEDLDRAIRWLGEVGVSVSTIGLDGTQEWAL